MKLTPCIVYAGKRLSCQQLAEQFAVSLPKLPTSERRQLEARMNELNQQFGDAMQHVDERILKMLVRSGVCYHHSGLAPLARVFLEALIKEGQVRFVVATMGLSLGVNFAVRSTMISDAMRPGDGGPKLYSASEILQMTGRAGRRGNDVVGYCLWPNPTFYSKLANPKREAVGSNLKKPNDDFRSSEPRHVQVSDQAILSQQFYELPLSATASS